MAMVFQPWLENQHESNHQKKYILTQAVSDSQLLIRRPRLQIGARVPPAARPADRVFRTPCKPHHRHRQRNADQCSSH